MDKLPIPPPLHNLLLNRVDNYYNNDLNNDLTPTTITTILIGCLTKQTSIGWGYILRGRTSSLFHPILNKYYRSNKIGRRFKSSS